METRNNELDQVKTSPPDELANNGWKYGGGKNGPHKSLGGRQGRLDRIAGIDAEIKALKGKPSQGNAALIEKLAAERKHHRFKLDERPEPHGVREKGSPNRR
jgi:hypothetical protein